jgi:hypothetical protein
MRGSRHSSPFLCSRHAPAPASGSGVLPAPGSRASSRSMAAWPIAPGQSHTPSSRHTPRLERASAQGTAAEASRTNARPAPTVGPLLPHARLIPGCSLRHAAVRCAWNDGRPLNPRALPVHAQHRQHPSRPLPSQREFVSVLARVPCLPCAPHVATSCRRCRPARPARARGRRAKVAQGAPHKARGDA